MDVAALILAGGKATRFGGVAKHELIVEGVSIFERQVAVLAPRVVEILVSSPTEVRNYRTVRDSREDVGPLAGIAAGLRNCPTPWLIVVAGDMPYISGTLIDRMIGSIHRSIDAVGLHVGGLPEPLVCALSITSLVAVERRVEEGKYKASGLLTDEGLRVDWLDADPAELRNVNSPEDLG